ACGIDPGGAAWCWGSNGSGRLGDGTTTTRSSPAAVSGGLQFAAISAGGAYTCAIATSGAGYCWGAGANGLLGNGTTSDQLSPALVTPTPGGVLLTSISARSAHTCATTTVQTIVCWGVNTFGQLGDATNFTRLVATAVSGGLTWDQVQVGAEHSCGRATTGGIYCWGRNDAGAVGDGTLFARKQPVGAVRP
ncbi:MAG TPA: hypothetical protein VL241_04195, partial [Gemmatimonadales bacterium]|nr:hypothetical protein [Gemmatimonadales bacterium]